jgi:hypothetical protein
MIFDLQIELENLQKQPEYIGVSKKIDSLISLRKYYYDQYQKREHDTLLKKMEEVDNDIQLFQNILLFWKRNYEMVANLQKSFAEQVEAANKGGQLLTVIKDLNMVLEFETDYSNEVNKLLLTAYESKMDTSKMTDALNSLRHKVKDYIKAINKWTE